MKIEYYYKEVYGKPLMYVADERISGWLYALTGKKTIDGRDIYALQQLGHTFKRVFGPTDQRGVSL